MLTDGVEQLKGIGEKTKEDLHLMGIKTVGDLLEHLPSRYDVTEVKPLNELIHDDQVTIIGRIIYEPVVSFFGRKKSRMSFTVEIENAAVKAVMFNRAFAQKHLKQGKTVTLTGKWDAHRLQITVQHYQLGEPKSEVTIQPFYSTKGNVTNAKMKTIIKQALGKYQKEIIEILPETYLTEYKIPLRKDAIQTLHLPNDRMELKHARRRMIYEELLLFQLKMQLLKFKHKEADGGIIQAFNREKVNEFTSNLPFSLTDGQADALKEIFVDMSKNIQMNRLLQGDVGSGKTVVANIALYASVTAGFQGAFMVPTEILAEQHYYSLSKTFRDYDIEVALLTSSVKGLKRRELLEKIENKEIDIVIGTHSLIQEEVIFNKLGFIVVDEQHRFGVEQRKKLREKGLQPDVLYMTATPIPRTLAITAFGDMDVSQILELPAGRKEIETYWVKENMLERILAFIGKQIAKGEQAYVVTPLIEESENFDYQNAIDLYGKLQQYYGNTLQIGLLHGKMLQEEKESMMEQFSDNKIQILVSTTVIEVGVNVPNATIMLIYNAERFGLSQLHQLRGRVGRGEKQSYCILLADPKGEVGKERMSIMQTTNNGFELSEADLKLRGPGDFFGEKQSGLPVFKVADMIHDYRALEVARTDAEKIVEAGLLFDDLSYKNMQMKLQPAMILQHFD